MLNSMLLLCSCYKKNKKISNLCTILMIFNLFIVQYKKVMMSFFIINVILMAAISIMSKKIKNEKLNTIISVFSVLIWSVMIDVICFYIMPLYDFNMNIFSYTLNGIFFNLKYVVSNVAIVVLINCINYLITFLKSKIISESNKKLDFNFKLVEIYKNKLNCEKR